MPRLTVAAHVITASYYPVTPLGAGSADVPFTAVDDQTDRETPLVNGKTMIYAFNSDTVARTITIKSQPDPTFNRLADITNYSVAAGKLARFGPFLTSGWGNAGKLEWDVSDPKLRVAIEQLP